MRHPVSVSDRVLFQMLKDNPNIRQVVLCLDSDEPGQTGSDNALPTNSLFREPLSEILVPVHKDWNEDLLTAVSLSISKEQEVTAGMGNTTLLIVIAAVMFAVIGGITLASHLYNLNGIKSKTVGDGQHGTARFATKSEIRRTYRQVPFTPGAWRRQAKKNQPAEAATGHHCRLQKQGRGNRCPCG